MNIVRAVILFAMLALCGSQNPARAEDSGSGLTLDLLRSFPDADMITQLRVIELVSQMENAALDSSAKSQFAMWRVALERCMMKDCALFYNEVLAGYTNEAGGTGAKTGQGASNQGPGPGVDQGAGPGVGRPLDLLESLRSFPDADVNTQLKILEGISQTEKSLPEALRDQATKIRLALEKCMIHDCADLTQIVATLTAEAGGTGAKTGQDAGNQGAGPGADQGASQGADQGAGNQGADNQGGAGPGGGQQPYDPVTNAGGNQSPDCIAAQNAVADAQAGLDAADALFLATLRQLYKLNPDVDLRKFLLILATQLTPFQKKVDDAKAEAQKICNTPTKATTATAGPASTPPPPLAPSSPATPTSTSAPQNADCLQLARACHAAEVRYVNATGALPYTSLTEMREGYFPCVDQYAYAASLLTPQTTAQQRQLLNQWANAREAYLKCSTPTPPAVAAQMLFVTAPTRASSNPPAPATNVVCGYSTPMAITDGYGTLVPNPIDFTQDFAVSGTCCPAAWCLNNDQSLPTSTDPRTATLAGGQCKPNQQKSPLFGVWSSGMQAGLPLTTHTCPAVSPTTASASPAPSSPTSALGAPYVQPLTAGTASGIKLSPNPYLSGTNSGTNSGRNSGTNSGSSWTPGSMSNAGTPATPSTASSKPSSSGQPTSTSVSTTRSASTTQSGQQRTTSGRNASATTSQASSRRASFRSTGAGHSWSGGGSYGGSRHPSDIRLKEDMVPLGRLDNGIGVYRFRYRGNDHTRYVGVMAQEVQTIVPNAVSRRRDGYLLVDYDMLGLKFLTWDEWMVRGSTQSRTVQ
jgi:hypothetical protein